jgi:hypothetical protein
MTKFHNSHQPVFSSDHISQSDRLNHNLLSPFNVHQPSSNFGNVRSSKQDPGNTPKQALKLPAFFGKRVFRNAVNPEPGNSSDYYRLKINKTSRVSLYLNELSTGSLNLNVLDTQQKPLKGDISALFSYPPQFLGVFEDVQPGVYYVRVKFAPPERSLLPDGAISYRLQLVVSKQ